MKATYIIPERSNLRRVNAMHTAYDMTTGDESDHLWHRKACIGKPTSDDIVNQFHNGLKRRVTHLETKLSRLSSGCGTPGGPACVASTRPTR